MQHGPAACLCTEHFHVGIFNSTAANYSTGPSVTVCACVPQANQLAGCALPADQEPFVHETGLCELRLPREQIRQRIVVLGWRARPPPVFLTTWCKCTSTLRSFTRARRAFSCFFDRFADLLGSARAVSNADSNFMYSIYLCTYVDISILHCRVQVKCYILLYFWV